MCRAEIDLLGAVDFGDGEVRPDLLRDGLEVVLDVLAVLAPRRVEFHEDRTVALDYRVEVALIQHEVVVAGFGCAVVGVVVVAGRLVVVFAEAAGGRRGHQQEGEESQRQEGAAVEKGAAARVTID